MTHHKRLVREDIPLYKILQIIITRIRVQKCDTNVKQNPIGLKRSIVTSLRLLFHGINR